MIITATGTVMVMDMDMGTTIAAAMEATDTVVTSMDMRMPMGDMVYTIRG